MDEKFHRSRILKNYISSFRNYGIKIEFRIEFQFRKIFRPLRKNLKYFGFGKLISGGITNSVNINAKGMILLPLDSSHRGESNKPKFIKIQSLDGLKIGHIIFLYMCDVRFY